MEIAKIFLQLGVAGAALFLIYHLVNKLFEYLKDRNTSDSKKDNKFDKLCDKIEKLVEAFYQSSKEMSMCFASTKCIV